MIRRNFIKALLFIGLFHHTIFLKDEKRYTNKNSKFVKLNNWLVKQDDINDL